MIISRIILSALAGYLAYLALSRRTAERDKESAFIGILVCLLVFLAMAELYERI